MNILVVGCGKVGSRLASVLSREGHDVSIVDRLEESFELLDDDFEGFKTGGVPIDQDVLRRAGIESCDALAAVSSDDNVNIMVSELAREIFHVPTVIARIYDPAREEVFSTFGLHTVCPTNLTVSAVRSAILEQGKPKTLNINSHTLSFSVQELPKSLIGSTADSYPLQPNQSLYAIIHEDLSLTLYQGQELRFAPGDEVIVSVVVD